MEHPDASIHGIIPQDQPTNKTCVHTCLAMAIGVPVEKVINRYGPEPLNQANLEFALTECRLIWNRFTQGTLAFEGWYLAAVPSLNLVGGMHQILIHSTFDEGITVLDPAIGKKYKRDGSDILSWSDLTPFHRGGKFPE